VLLSNLLRRPDSRLALPRDRGAGAAEDVAAASGISRGGLSLIEQGKRPNPTLHTLEALARVLRIQIAITPRGATVERSP
jgi:transcriptional regulator with XRE-family HTH domain